MNNLTRPSKVPEKKDLKLMMPKSIFADIKEKNRNYSTTPKLLPPFRPISLKPLNTLKSAPFGLKLLGSELTFQVIGDYPDVLKELKSRGWKYAGSNSKKFQLLWSRHARVAKDFKENIIVNHISNIYEISTKDYLCENLKGIAQGFFPECYLISHKRFERFSVVFQKRFIENLLKDLEKTTGSDEEVTSFIKNSQHSKAIQEYLAGKNILTKKDLAEWVLELKKDLQSSIQGFQNLWIVKPDKLSRGRGIKILKDLEAIRTYTAQGSWVIQKYIESPLLINRRKFDIRQWVLITSNNNFSAYFYCKCYLRFSSEVYDISDLENLFVHLTNNSIVKYSNNFKEEDSMWDSEQFKNWLIRETGRDMWQEISKKTAEIVQTTISAVKPKISQRKRCFELLGYDFMIDSEYKPWLIEINTSPALDYSTVISMQPVTERLVKELIPQVFKVIFEERPSPGFLKLCV